MPEIDKPRPLEAHETRALQAACDTILDRAVVMMADELQAPVNVIIDRLVTWAAAQSCVSCGRQHTAGQFRDFAEKIDGGMFDGLTGENRMARH